MKKVSTFTVGCDLGDKWSEIVVLDADAEIETRERVRTTKDAFRRRFSKMPRGRVALEVGVHSRWASRLLADLGFDVLVANPRRLHLIFGGVSKSDASDAEWLARLAKFDPKLLGPIEHRSETRHRDLVLLRARDTAVRARTKLINSVRGLVKPFGLRIQKCSAETFAKKFEAPEELADMLSGLVSQIEALTKTIRDYDHRIAERALAYPEVSVLTEIPGVGTLSAMAFVLAAESPDRFKKSRNIGPFFGLVPKRSQSGDTDRQLRITKAGNPFVRRLLVQCAQYILGPFGPDTDLRRFGLRMAERGGKNAKKRSVVATARKLAVLMHRLWSTGEVYQPLGYRP